MRLVRFGDAGLEKPGLLDESGRVRDLSGVVRDIDGAMLAPDALKRLRTLDVSRLPVVEGDVRFGCPVASPQKFIAIGLNYRDHAAEAKLPIPAEPIIFQKAVSSIGGPNDDIVIPRNSSKTDWEVELGVVIGTRASYVSEQEALDFVAGYVALNDVSERSFQMDRGGTWDKGKGCDSFGPVGPWLATRDEVPDPQALGMWLNVNGTRVQTGNTANMIFTVARIVSYVSEFMTLVPGDIIATGTPAGVGMGLKPEPVFLRHGDVVELGIDGLGQQSQRCVSYQS